MKLYPHNYAEIFAAIVALVCFLRKKTFLNKTFTFYLWLTVVVEFLGKYLRMKEIPNAFVYNVFNIVELFFYCWIIYRFSQHDRTKRFIIYGSITYVLFALIDAFFIEGPFIFNNYSTILGSLVILVSCLMYVWEMLDVEHEKEPSNTAMPYLIFGLVIFYLGTFVLYATFNYLQKNAPEMSDFLFRLINRNLNVVLYVCFSLGLFKELHMHVKESLVDIYREN